MNINNNAKSVNIIIYRMRHKNNPVKTLSRERHNLNYNVLKFATFIDKRYYLWFWKFHSHIRSETDWSYSCFHQKVRFYNWTFIFRDCYTENANKINCMELIWNEECPPNSMDLDPLDYHIGLYGLRCSRCTNVTHQRRPTLMALKNVAQAIWADLPQGPN